MIPPCNLYSLIHIPQSSPSNDEYCPDRLPLLRPNTTVEQSDLPFVVGSRPAVGYGSIATPVEWGNIVNTLLVPIGLVYPLYSVAPVAIE